MGVQIDYYGKLFTNDTPVTPAIARAANIAKTYGLALVKAKTPVDTGRLKETWDARLEGAGIRWTNPQPYAGFVEFGTRKMAARSMLTSSIGDIEEVFTSELYNEIGANLGAEIISGSRLPSYETAGSGSKPDKYPNVGSKLQPKIKTGLSKRDKKTSKKFLFADPSKILSDRQQSRIDSARPLYGRKK